MQAAGSTRPVAESSTTVRRPPRLGVGGPKVPVNAVAADGDSYPDVWFRSLGLPKSAGSRALERNESEFGTGSPRLERAERNPGMLRERRCAS